MNKLFLMMSVLLSAGLFCACSNDGDEDLNEGSVEPYEGLKEGPSTALGDMNILHVQTDKGQTETCWLYRPYCGTNGSIEVSKADGTSSLDYPMIFTAIIKNSSFFNVLQIDIRSDKPIKIEDLNVGDTFSGDPLWFPVINVKAWQRSSVEGIIPCESLSSAKGGQIQVVDKKTVNEVSFITLSLQDLKFYEYDSDWNRIYYTLNATIEFEICEGGVYPKAESTPQEPNMEKLTTPSDELVFFMMDALYKNETHEKQTFFGEGPEIVEGSGKQECLLINSYQELQEAYKGDRNIFVDIPFDYCTLVIGRTYGQHGGISIGDFDLVDKGDSYQLNLTLNNNINPHLVYTNAFIDLYFWKLIPKVENKPVVFNRITQEVNLDPLSDSAYPKMRNRWLLQSYVDADGTLHQVSKEWGDENYTIEFKENGRVEGRIDANTFSGNYSLPYWYVLDGKYDNWNGDYIYGIINLWDVYTTMVYHDDPLSEALSEAFKHVFNAIEFKIWTSGDKVYSLTIRTPDHESFGFFYENIKQNYGFK